MNEADPNDPEYDNPSPEETGNLSRRERKRLETRERLFEAALTLLSERDFETVTVEMITEAADVGKGTFFNYFANKEGILAYYFEVVCGMLTEGLHTQAEALRKFFADPNPDLPLMREALWDQVSQMIHRLAALDARSKKLTRTLLALTQTNEAVRQANLNVKQQTFGNSIEFVRFGQSIGAMRDDQPPEVIARFFKSAYMGTLMDWAQSDTDSDLIELLDQHITLLKDALKPQSKT